jgi:hypothetical protein
MPMMNLNHTLHISHFLNTPILRLKHTIIMAPILATATSRLLDIRAAFKSELLDGQILQNARRAVLAVGPEIAKRSTEHPINRRGLTVNSTQQVTLGIIAVYVVVIALLWNLPYVRWSLWPFKVIGASTTHYFTILCTVLTQYSRHQMLVIAFHEFGHAITACCTGGRVKSISLDPREGGVTHMQGGISAITLPAGYLGSSLIGALLIFCGFDIVASKVASIVLGVCFLLTLWWARKDWLTIGTILLAVGLLVACWFIKHAEPLRFVVVS